MEKQRRRVLFERYQVIKLGGMAAGLATLAAVVYEISKQVSRPETLLDEAARRHKGGALIKTAASILGSPADLLSYESIAKTTRQSKRIAYYAVSFLVEQGLARRGQDAETQDYYVRLDPRLPQRILREPEAYQHVIDATKEFYPDFELEHLALRFGPSDNS